MKTMTDTQPKEETKHTPLPWGDCGLSVVDRNGETIAVAPADKNADANIRFIIRAVNSHDELVEALKDMVLEFDLREHRDGCICSCCSAIRQARAALAKATKEL